LEVLLKAARRTNAEAVSAYYSIIWNEESVGLEVDELVVKLKQDWLGEKGWEKLKRRTEANSWVGNSGIRK
jgi:hypothetical protein